MDEATRVQRAAGQDVGGLNGLNATTKPATIGATWRWDDRIEGPISASETRPLLATMRLVSVGTEYNVGSNNTLQFAVNPQISVENDEATEGHRHAPDLQCDAAAPCARNDHGAVLDDGRHGYRRRGGLHGHQRTLTWTAGQSIKKVRVPIIDDSVSDGGEEMLLVLANASE